MEQVDLLRTTLEVLSALSIEHTIVGSLASMAYGEPRLTRGIDIVIDLTSAQVDPLCDAFPAGDFYISPTAARQAVSTGGQFNIIHPASGNKVDLLLVSDDAWGRSELARRRFVPLLPVLIAPLTSPEDVIIGKLRYYREGEHEKHLRDILAMLQLSGDRIDVDYIAGWSKELGLTDIWQAIVVRWGST